MDQVEEVKRRLEVAEVVGGYLQLKQSGRNLKASCPFHNEKTASFMVSPEKGIWHCFGCGEGGDIFKFVMMIEGLEFRAALETLAKRAGVELEVRPAARESAKVRNRLTEANRLAIRYYQECLAKNPQAIKYIVQRRELKKETVREFQIGYAPDSWEGLTRFLIKRGYGEKELVAAGLAGQKRGTYDLFRGRIMLPIFDGQGEPIGFTGRILGEGEPKYLNTPQTLLYDKSRAVFGLHLAKEAVRKEDAVVLVEGNMDVVMSHQAGVRNVVAASGTALTADQLKALSRFTRRIKVAFDQDSAGLKASARAIELASQLGLRLEIVEIEAKDPDELIRDDAGKWRKAIEQSKDVFSYWFDRLSREFDLTTPLGKRQYSDRMAGLIRIVADAVEREAYMLQLAEKVGISLESVKLKVEDASSAHVAEQVKLDQSVKTEVLSPGERIQMSMLAMAVAYPECRIFVDDLTEANFMYGTQEDAVIFKALQSRRKQSSGELAKLLPEQAERVKILALRGEEEFASLSPAERSHEAFGLSRRLQNLSNKQLQDQLTTKIAAAEQSGDAERARLLLAEYQTLIENQE
jgi:DNA primase